MTTAVESNQQDEYWQRIRKALDVLVELAEKAIDPNVRLGAAQALVDYDARTQYS